MIKKTFAPFVAVLSLGVAQASLAQELPAPLPANTPQNVIGVVPNLPTTTSSTATSDYALRPGDLISINMVGDPPVTTTLAIPMDGRISFYNVNGVMAVGKSRAQLENELTQGVKRWIKNPSITVNLLGSPYDTISISGAVEKPGEISYRRGLTIFEALTLVGGARVSANKTAMIYRKTPDGKPDFLTVDLMKLYNGDVTQDLPLQPGDKVIVNDALIYINGLVKNPGMFTLRTADTVAKAIAAAGGVAEGSDLQNSFIRRGDTTIPVDIRQVVEGNGTGNGVDILHPLQAGDILFVPTLQNKVLVIGDVTSTGPIYISPKINDKVLDVLATAGATSRTADLKRIQLVRMVNGNQIVKTELDLSQDGPQSDNVILQNGDLVYVSSKKERNRSDAILNATLVTQLVSFLRNF